MELHRVCVRALFERARDLRVVPLFLGQHHGGEERDHVRGEASRLKGAEGREVRRHLAARGLRRLMDSPDHTLMMHRHLSLAALAGGQL